MNVGLWIVQGVLALAFLASGLVKSTQPKEKLAGQMGWVEDYPANSIRLIGFAELLGAIGLIVPPLFDILAWLAPVAALGLAAIMAGAVQTHRRRNETREMALSGTLLVLAIAVVIGRVFIESF